MAFSDESPEEIESQPKVFVYRIQQRKGLPTLRGEILLYDGLWAESRKIRVERNAACPVRALPIDSRCISEVPS